MLSYIFCIFRGSSHADPASCPDSTPDSLPHTEEHGRSIHVVKSTAKKKLKMAKSMSLSDLLRDKVAVFKWSDWLQHGNYSWQVRIIVKGCYLPPVPLPHMKEHGRSIHVVKSTATKKLIMTSPFHGVRSLFSLLILYHISRSLVAELAVYMYRQQRRN